MKKLTFFALSLIITVCVFSACNMPFASCTAKRLRKSMTEYYSNNENYSQLEGKIISVGAEKLLIDVISSNGEFSFREGINSDYFMLTNIDSFDLKCGEVITFTSAPKQFYDGHHFPIVAIEKDGVVLLDFETGKANLLNWIENDFN